MVAADSPAGSVNMQAQKSSKKAKRRSASFSDQNENKEVKPKKKPRKHSFTEVEFCVGLRDSSTTFQALENFLQTASEYPETTDFDIVGSYCRSSGECIEILKLLEGGEKRKPAEISRIFEVLEIILVNIASRLPKLKPVGKAIVRRILAGHVGTIIYCLNMKNKSGQIKSGLKLLSAMVMQGDTTPRDILAQVDLQHPAWPPLLNRRDLLDPMDVRGCLLHFMLSFLMVGEKDTIRAVLEIRGFLNGIFSGLVSDKQGTLQMVLPTLKEKIVQNSDISKTLKVRLFSDRALADLVKLYRWKGPQKYSSERRKSKGEENMVVEEEDDHQGEASNDPQSEDRAAIADLVHKLLLEICCDFKLGINFFDKSYGTSGKNQNHVLTTFLSGLKLPHLSSRLSELVVEVLKACPDQLKWYLPALKHSLTPRVSNKWVAAMTLLHKVYEAQPEVAPCMKLNHRVPINKLVTMARSNIIPPKEIWSHIITAVRHASPVVQHEALLIVHLTLKRVKATIDFCSENHPLYSSAELKIFIAGFRDTIAKTCPDVPTLMQCWSRAVRSTVGKSSEIKSGGDMEEDMNEDEDIDIDDVVAKGFPEVAQADHLLRVLQALCEYQAVLPEVFAENSVNFGLLLEGVRASSTDDSVSTHQVSLLQIHLLRLLAESRVRQLTWLKESFCGRSTLYLLLEMIAITHSNPRMLTVAINLLQKLFVSTGLFLHTESEVTLWLEQIAAAAVESSETEVLVFVEKVFSAVLKDPFTYTEKVTEAVSEGGTREGGDAAERGSTATTSDHIIDTILSMDEVDLSTGDQSMQVSPTTTIQARYPFSVLVPSSLRLWTEEYKDKEGPTHKGVKQYLRQVMHSILHTQVDPVPLCVLLQQYKSTSLEPLTKRWMPTKKGNVTPKKAKHSRSDDAQLPDLLIATFSGPVSTLLSPEIQGNLEEKCKDLDLDICQKTIIQLLLYMKTCASEAREDDKMIEATGFYLKLITTIIQSVTSLKQDVNQEETPGSDPDDLQKDDLHLGSLKVTKPSAKDILQSIYSTVATHPDLEEWFLWERPEGAKSQEIKIGLKLRSVVTRRMTTLLGDIPLDIVPRLSNDLRKYREKTREQYSEYIESLRSGAVDTEQDNTDVLEAMGSTLRFTPWSDIIEDAQLLTQLPPNVLVGKNEQLTSQGKLLLTFLSHVLLSMETKESLGRNVLSNLSLDSVSRMFSLAAKHSLPELDTALLGLLRACPLYAMAANHKHFLQCLDEPHSSAGLKLVEMLVAHSEVCCRWFASWWAGLGKNQKKDVKWTHLPIVHQYALSLCPGDNKLMTKELSRIQSLYWSDLVTWIQSSIDPDGEETRARISLLRFLTATSQNLESVQGSWGELLVFLTGCSRLTVLQAEYVHLASESVARLDTDETLPVWDVYVSTCLTCVSNLLNTKGAKANRPAVQIILTNVLTVLENRKGEDHSLAEVVQPVWNQLIKAGLRSLYTNVSMLAVLRHLIGVVYCSQSDIIPAHTMYEMLMSHSQFLSTMLETGNMPLKDALVDLMLALAQKEPAKCCTTPAHVTVLLGAYGATLHKTDQKILLLMALYESSGCNLEEHRPFLWGPKAVEHHSIKKSLGASLWKQATTDQILEVLDSNILSRSCLHFPLQRKLRSEDVVEPESVSSVADVYDPCFILPLFSQLLGPSMMVNCFKIVESGTLSYLFCALSSHDPAMRGAAYHVLSEFYQHVEGLRFPGKDQVLYLLETVKNSISTPNLKLASIVTTFLARAAKLMVNPEAVMYSGVNEFLLLKPSMDVLNVPEFYKFFNSSTLEYKGNRSWMLSLLADGLRETADYRLFEKRYVFKLILSFHDSALSDERTQVQVLKVLHQAVKHRTIAVDLIKYDAILAWINGVIKSSAPSLEKEEVIVDILDSLWKTMSFARTDSQGHVKVASIPLGFTNEMLHLLLHLLHSLRGLEDIRVMRKFVSLLNSVLSHLRMTVSAMAGHDPICVALKTTDMLELLHLWSSVNNDHHTIHDLSLLSTLTERVSKEAAENQKKKTLHKKTVTETEATDANETLSEQSRNDMEMACLHDVLEVISHWKPTQTSTNASIDIPSLLFIMEWCVSRTFVNFSGDLALFSCVLQWIQAWVLHPSSLGLRTVLISDKTTPAQFISNMLSIYGHCTQVILGRSVCMMPSSVEVVRVTRTIKTCVTQILAALIDHALRDGSASRSMLNELLHRPEYCSAMELMPKIKHSHSTVYLLLQELWLKASKPSQFRLMAEQVIEDAV